MIANLTWMAGVSYSVPMNPHVAAAPEVSILTEIFYCLQGLLCAFCLKTLNNATTTTTMCFLKTPSPASGTQIQL